MHKLPTEWGPDPVSLDFSRDCGATDTGKYFFTQYTISLWNSLPLDSRETKSFAGFTIPRNKNTRIYMSRDKKQPTKKKNQPKVFEES